MPKACPICQHKDRQGIEKALLDNETLHQIAQRYEVSKRSLFNHKKNHISKALLNAQDAQAMVMADGLLQQLRQLQEKAITILNKAEKAGQLRVALQGIREARGCLELVLKAFEASNLEARIRKLEDKMEG